MKLNVGRVSFKIRVNVFLRVPQLKKITMERQDLIRSEFSINKLVNFIYSWPELKLVKISKAFLKSSHALVFEIKNRFT